MSKLHRKYNVEDLYSVQSSELRKSLGIDEYNTITVEFLKQKLGDNITKTALNVLNSEEYGIYLEISERDKTPTMKELYDISDKYEELIETLKLYTTKNYIDIVIYYAKTLLEKYPSTIVKITQLCIKLLKFNPFSYKTLIDNFNLNEIYSIKSFDEDDVYIINDIPDSFTLKDMSTKQLYMLLKTSGGNIKEKYKALKKFPGIKTLIDKFYGRINTIKRYPIVGINNIFNSVKSLSRCEYSSIINIEMLGQQCIERCREINEGIPILGLLYNKENYVANEFDDTFTFIKCIMTGIKNEDLHRIRFRQLIKHMKKVDNPYSVLAESILYLTKMKLKYLPEIIDVIVKDGIDLKFIIEFKSNKKDKTKDDAFLYKKGQDVHSENRDEAAKKIILDFITKHDKMNIDPNYLKELREKFWQGIFKFPEEKKALILRALGKDEHYNDARDLRDFGGLISSPLYFNGVNYDSEKFLSYLMFFAKTYNDPECKEGEDEPYDSCIKRNRKNLVYGIYSALIECLYIGHIVCNEGKFQRIITSVLDHKYILTDGTFANLEGKIIKEKDTATFELISDIKTVSDYVIRYFQTFPGGTQEDFFRGLFHYVYDMDEMGIHIDIKVAMLSVFLINTETGYGIDFDYERSLYSLTFEGINLAPYIKTFYQTDIEGYYLANPEVKEAKEKYEEDRVKRLEAYKLIEAKKQARLNKSAK